MQGIQGVQGNPGSTGSPGADGISPVANVQSITGGARITITDANGTTTADVMDGATGQTGPAGPGVPSGGTDGQVLTKDGSTDYATRWETPSGGGGVTVEYTDVYGGSVSSGTMTGSLYRYYQSSWGTSGDSSNVALTGYVNSLKLTQFIDDSLANPIVASILEPVGDYYNGPDFLDLKFTAPNAGLFADLTFYIPNSVFTQKPNRGFG